MAGAPATAADWILDFGPNGPKFTPPAGGFTVFKVPKHLLGGSPDYENNFKIGMLQLGLQNRTLKLDAPETVFQDLKLEIGSVLHHRLSKPPPTPAPPVTPAPVSIIKSWDDFAKAVVDNADTARGHFEKPTDDEHNPRMADDAVQNHLALDALFIVFYFQCLNAKAFNIKDFETLANDRGATLKSLGLSDFLLLENQVPMYLLKKVVEELCKIDDGLPTKLSGLSWHPIPFEGLVERELNKVLVVAVLNLLPISKPTVVHPTLGSCPPMNIFSRAVQRMSVIASSSRTCMLRNCGRHRKTKVPGNMLIAYLNAYYPLHEKNDALENCKHILDCVYRVVCGHLEVGTYRWDTQQLDNPFLESIPGATQLEEVGIKLEHSTQCTGNSVELTHGYLTLIRSARFKLPRVDILDHTARFFRNLAIYEQLVGQDMTQYNSDLRCYLVCMYELCRNSTDLQLLSRRGVFNVHVRDEVAVSMWGKIMEGVERPIPSNAWKKCYDNVHSHRRSGWRRWRRKQFGMFLSQPWKKLSIIFGTVLLFLTALQTWFTVVNSPHSKERWPSRN